MRSRLVQICIVVHRLGKYTSQVNNSLQTVYISFVVYYANENYLAVFLYLVCQTYVKDMYRRLKSNLLLY